MGLRNQDGIRRGKNVMFAKTFRQTSDITVCKAGICQRDTLRNEMQEWSINKERAMNNGTPTTRAKVWLTRVRDSKKVL